MGVGMCQYSLNVHLSIASGYTSVCIGYESGMHRDTHEVINLSVKLSKGSFGARPYIHAYMHTCIHTYIHTYFTSLPRPLGPTMGRRGREGGGGGRAQLVQDRVPPKASRTRKEAQDSAHQLPGGQRWTLRLVFPDGAHNKTAKGTTQAGALAQSCVQAVHDSGS